VNPLLKLLQREVTDNGLHSLQPLNEGHIYLFRARSASLCLSYVLFLLDKFQGCGGY
jgi:hypothetical protein